jgi:hypothetical protein
MNEFDEVASSIILPDDVTGYFQTYKWLKSNMLDNTHTYVWRVAYALWPRIAEEREQKWAAVNAQRKP